MWVIIALCVLSILGYFKISKPHNYWKNKNVLHMKPWPLVGNFGSAVFQTQALIEMLENIYKTFPIERYFGIYQFLLPCLVIRDLDLIKRIAVKDFENFPEHRTVVSKENDPLFGGNVFTMPGGEEWHKARAILSPSFTSSKMRMMFVLMQECAENAIGHFENKGTLTLEFKDLFSRFTSDVVGSTAFGVTCDSFKYPKNEFYSMGQDATNFTIWRNFKLFLYTISPTISKQLKLTILSKKLNAFFRRLIKETIKVREENSTIRPDMIHLLMEARKGQFKHDEHGGPGDFGFAIAQEEGHVEKAQTRDHGAISDEEITAHAVIFFLAGFDTASTAMCFAAYELALNPFIQEKLHEEVEKTLKEGNGKVTYEGLLGMKYMDLVVTETLRKWPPIPFTDRKAIKPFTIEPERPWEKTEHFDAGTICLFPIYPIHRDRKYYPNPEQFDPERFNDENKHNIKPFSYLPFGVGPRNCIASRFALLETKLILFSILNKFEFMVVDKTPIPMVLKKGQLFPGAEKGFWMGLKPRR